MEFVSCNNFRIRGDTIPNLNIEEFIKSIENQYDIDITSPEWRHAIIRIQAALIDYIRRIKDHKLRKALILEQLQKEFTYISPFYLADVKARTARKWERLKTRSVIKLDSIEPETIKSFSNKSVNPEINEEAVPEMIIPQMTIDDVNNNHVKEKVDTFLPPMNTMSFHTSNSKMSPVESEIYKLTTGSSLYRRISQQLLNKSIIKHSPKTIEIDSSQELTIELKFKNCANRIALIQYHSVIEMPKLKSISVLPVTAVKLVPGITYTFKLTIKPIKDHNFASKIKFNVKYPVASMTPSNSYYKYYVPIISQPYKKLEYRSVTAPETIAIPPIYPWLVKNKSKIYEYPFVTSNVSVDTKDTHSYYVRIVKRISDDTDNTNASNEINTTPSVLQTNASNEINTTTPRVLQTSTSSEINITTSKSIINTTTSNSSIRNEVLQLIVKIVESAMDVFVFDRTYLFLKSGETKFVRIYFVQVLHIGCHNCYYDFEFYDSASNELIFTKTTSVFTDVMPHPIQVKPDALDMTDTPIIFGQCGNSFVITNTHCNYPVNIRIVTSAKMKKLIKIIPMKTVIFQKKSAKFVVRLCASNRNPVVKKLDEDKHFDEDSLFVQFTLKILISSYVSAFKNITPIYYDIIAPLCNL